MASIILRCAPRYASSPRKQRKAIATQFSASSSIAVPQLWLGLAGIAQRSGDVLVAWPLPDQTLDDGAGGFGSDRPHVAHGGVASFGDRSFGRRKLVMQLGLEPFVQLIGFARFLLARSAGDALRAPARIGKRLFVSRISGIR